ncbi:MAG: hypothetical protein RIS64_2177 [Bacteroidota bacterium]|jgi:hypothetical protein
MQSSFPNLERSRKIETWFEMNFGDWRKELLRQKITISIRDLLDYQDLFES